MLVHAGETTIRITDTLLYVLEIRNAERVSGSEYDVVYIVEGRAVGKEDPSSLRIQT